MQSCTNVYVCQSLRLSAEESETSTCIYKYLRVSKSASVAFGILQRLHLLKLSYPRARFVIPPTKSFPRDQGSLDKGLLSKRLGEERDCLL